MNRSRGQALLTAIIFLVLLSLVALAAIRGTGLEVKSGSNHARRAAAFEAAETARTVIGPLIDDLCARGGWPARLGGTVPDSEFAAAMPSGITLADHDRVGGPDDWCQDADSDGSFDPARMTSDARYDRDLQATLGIQVHGEVAVRRLNSEPIAGAGQAQASGYGGSGSAMAAGGSQIFFHLRSQGSERVERAEAGSSTSATYRYVIRR
jgi:hypothetical protein